MRPPGSGFGFRSPWIQELLIKVRDEPIINLKKLLELYREVLVIKHSSVTDKILMAGSCALQKLMQHNKRIGPNSFDSITGFILVAE